MFNGRNIDIYFFEFPDIGLVDIDTTSTFLLHPHQEILNNVNGSNLIPSGHYR